MRGRKPNKFSQGGNKPPQIASNIQYTHRYRFTSTSATLTAITPQSLLGAAGTICTNTNTAVNPFNGSVRVKRVEMWAPPATQGSTTTCSVQWVGDQKTSNFEVSDTSNSVTTPAKISSSPPRLSLASFWNQNSTSTLFSLVAPVGTIIDVLLDLIVFDEDDAQVGITVATGALGNTYFLSLDPNATHRYVPVSLNTTI